MFNLLLQFTGKINCPDMKGWSFNDLHQFSNVSGIKLSIKGTGTVTSQSVAKGAELKSGEKIKVNLKE